MLVLLLILISLMLLDKDGSGRFSWELIRLTDSSAWTVVGETKKLIDKNN